MFAAIYARKSTEQRGVDEEQKSVTRQIEHARRYAVEKGWTIDEASVFVDDGISGAEFAKRPAFVRLMNALKPRPPFQVLIVMDESRLGRESIETAYALKQLTRAGVRVFCYLQDQERTLDTPIEKAMLALQAMSDEMEREKARARTYDAMRRKFEQGHVTGGQCFGYRNVDVVAPGPDGRPKRQYVRREVNEDEAAIVRRIFELCAAGQGLKAITKRLNDERVPAPRPQRGRPRAWAPSSVREILYREAYGGQLVWNKTRKRNADGEKRAAARAAGEWMRRSDEGLRIVPEALWLEAHRRLTERREHYDRGGAAAGRPVGPLASAWGARNAREARVYLLSGFARCAVCAAAIQAASRQSTTGRLFRYVCGGYVNRGAAVCGNQRMARMEIADSAIRELLANEVVRPQVLERALDLVIEQLRPERQADAAADRRRMAERHLADVLLRLERLSEVAARGGAAVAALVDALQGADRERLRLQAELAALDRLAPRTIAFNPRQVRAELRAYVEQWQTLTTENVRETRALLQTVLRDRIVFRPFIDGATPMYELTVPLQFDRLLVAAIPAIADGGGEGPSGRIGVPNGIRTLPALDHRLVIPAA